MHPTERDWVSDVLCDLETLNINMELSDIQQMSEAKFKQIIKNQIYSEAFKYLESKRQSRLSENPKGKYLEYSNLIMANYLCPSDIEISIDENKWIFK